MNNTRENSLNNFESSVAIADNNRTSTTYYLLHGRPLWNECMRLCKENKRKTIFCLSLVGIVTAFVMVFCLTGNCQSTKTIIDVLPGGNKKGQLNATLIYENHGYPTNICHDDNRDYCFVENCSLPGVAYGEWTNGISEIVTQGETIKILRDFEGNIKLHANLYRKTKDKYGWIIYLNGKPWITCAFHRHRDSETPKSKICEHKGEGQRYLLHNMTTVLTTVIVGDPAIVLKKDDIINVKLVGDNTILVGKPRIVFEGIVF